jgi:anti-sigma factor RsiW
MNCRDVVELLVDFVSGDLSEEFRTHVEQHLRCCPPCVTYIETYRLTIQLTRKLPCGELPPTLVQRLQAALDAELRKPAPGEG